MNQSNSDRNNEDHPLLADKFEELYQRIASPESRKAADQLFQATGEELRRSYRPGRTETSDKLATDLPDSN